MKKLLSLLAAIGLTATASSTVVACGNSNTSGKDDNGSGDDNGNLPAWAANKNNSMVTWNKTQLINSANSNSDKTISNVSFVEYDGNFSFDFDANVEVKKGSIVTIKNDSCSVQAKIINENEKDWISYDVFDITGIKYSAEGTDIADHMYTTDDNSVVENDKQKLLDSSEEVKDKDEIAHLNKVITEADRFYKVKNKVKINIHYHVDLAEVKNDIDLAGDLKSDDGNYYVSLVEQSDHQNIVDDNQCQMIVSHNIANIKLDKEAVEKYLNNK